VARPFPAVPAEVPREVSRGVTALVYEKSAAIAGQGKIKRKVRCHHKMCWKLMFWLSGEG
jgi:hypothetical protein